MGAGERGDTNAKKREHNLSPPEDTIWGKKEPQQHLRRENKGPTEGATIGVDAGLETRGSCRGG